MSSFSSYRTPNARSGSVGEDGSKDAKGNIRESRLIQDEQWELPEIQKAFEDVNNCRFLLDKSKNDLFIKGYHRFYSSTWCSNPTWY
jgi:hypothetical protein